MGGRFRDEGGVARNEARQRVKDGGNDRGFPCVSSAREQYVENIGVVLFEAGRAHSGRLR